MSQSAAEKGHEARDVDISAAGRGVWLVKVSLIQVSVLQTVGVTAFSSAIAWIGTVLQKFNCSRGRLESHILHWCIVTVGSQIKMFLTSF